MSLSILIVVLLLIIYVVWVLKKYGVALPFLLLFWIESFWVLLSLVYLDQGGKYISEELRFSFSTGAYIRYICILAPFWILTPILLKKFTKREQSIAFATMHLHSPYKFAISIKVIQMVSMGLFFYLLANVVISGAPLLHSNISRMNFYYSYSKFPFAAQLNGYFGPFLIFLNGVFLAQKDKPKYVLRNCLIILCIMLLYLILMTNKGYPFYLYSILLFLPTIALRFSTSIKKLKIKPIYIILPIIFIAAIIFVSYWNYSSIYQHPIEHLVSRLFALQGHSFWRYDYILGDKKYGLDLSLLKSEVEYTFSGIDIYSGKSGLSRIMYLISPNSVAYRYLSGRSRFTGGYWTVCLGFLGVFGTMLYSVIVALIFSMICKAIYVSILEKNYIGMYISFTTYYEYYTYFRIGDLSYLLSGKMIILLILTSLFILFHKQLRISFY